MTIRAVLIRDEFFHVVEDTDNKYWVCNNTYPDCTFGPFDKLQPAYRVYFDANRSFQFLRDKGVLVL